MTDLTIQDTNNIAQEETTLQVETPVNTAGSVAIESYHWQDFLAGGKAQHLYTVGVLNRSLKKSMLLKEGEVATIASKQHELEYKVTYDADFVLEKLARQLEHLGIVEGGNVDKEALDWLLKKLVDYCENFAERQKLLSNSSIIKKAKELHKQFPHHTEEFWLSTLQPKEVAIAAETAIAAEDETEKPPAGKTTRGKTVKA